MKILKNSATPCERIAFLERQVAAQQHIMQAMRVTISHLQGDHKKCPDTCYGPKPKSDTHWCPEGCHLYNQRTCTQCKGYRS